MFCYLFDLKRAGLRLTSLNNAMCPRFHVDGVPCRLVTTYQGIATEWLPHGIADRSKLGRGNQGKSDEQSGLFNNAADIKKLYQENHIEHELFDFDDKLLIKAVNYDLAITRAGASTISELGYLNIPFLAIPFPYAKDDHQYYNAEFYEKNKSCWLIMQKDIDENNFIDLTTKIFEDQNEYFSKKNNLIQLTKENTWEKNKSKLIELINEN